MAQYRNEFIRKLKHFIDIINGEEVSSLIPASILDALCNCRSHPFKIAAAPDNIVPSEVVKDIRETISSQSKNDAFSITVSDKLEVTMEEYFTLILTIFLNLEKAIKEN